MEHPYQPTAELVQRLKNNECTPEELLLIRKWIAAMDLGDAATDIAPEVLAQFKAGMHNELMRSIHTTPAVPIHRRQYFRSYGAAAALLLLLVSGIVVWYIIRRTSVAERSPVAGLTVIENNKKNIVQKITLPDGTLVWLNRHSRLEFDPQEYNGAQRSVKLSGEGFFEVIANKGKPFVVETGNLHTRVLGTAFNIEAYHQESEIRVSLVHGKVALDDKATDRTTFLTPNQTLRYSKDTRTWKVLPMAVNTIEQWRNGHLVFNEVPLQEAIERIEDRYGIHIAYDPALLRNKRITAIFAGGDWPSVLQQVLFVHGLEYKQVQQRISIIKPSAH